MKLQVASTTILTARVNIKPKATRLTACCGIGFTIRGTTRWNRQWKSHLKSKWHSGVEMWTHKVLVVEDGKWRNAYYKNDHWHIEVGFQTMEFVTIFRFLTTERWEFSFGD